MSLSGSSGESDIERRKADKREIARLLGTVDHDIADAAVPGLSVDRRFIIAYEAAHNLATITVRASGYRVKTSCGGHHFRTFELLPRFMGEAQQERADYLNDCRKRRNHGVYEEAGRISKKEADGLLEDTLRFRNEVLGWLRENHPNLL